MELAFGGPTGWAVAALLIRPGIGPDHPQSPGSLRRWHVSPRYPNPDWYPITQVAASPERRFDRLPGSDWIEVRAPADGLPVVELGTNRQAEIGDVVYAVTTITFSRFPESDAAFRRHQPHAQLWLNGREVGYVPNIKGSVVTSGSFR